MKEKTLEYSPTLGDEKGLSEEQFYSLYDWCINPALSLNDLFQRLREQIDQFKIFRPKWQQTEWKINLYLFVCAIECVVSF